MLRKISSLLTCALLLFFSTSLYSHEYNKREAKIQELLQLTKTEAVIKESIQLIVDDSIKKNPQLTPYKAEFSKAMHELIDYKEMHDFLIQLYSKHFNEDDIDAIIKFYRSPAGQNALTSLPKISAEVGIFVATMTQKNRGKITALITEISAKEKEALQ